MGDYREKAKELLGLLAKATPEKWSVQEESEEDINGTTMGYSIAIPEINRLMFESDWADTDEWDDSLARTTAIVELHNAAPALIARLLALEDVAEAEKQARVRYQDIVYAVCNELDIYLCNASDGKRLVATKEAVITDLRRALRAFGYVPAERNSACPPPTDLAALARADAKETNDAAV